VSLWADVNWSPSCFDQIAAAYFDRIAPHNIRANLVTSEIAASHRGSETLRHIIVASRDTAETAPRFLVGQSMGELMGVGPKGQPLNPLVAGLSPSDMALYVKHVKAYTAQLPPSSGVPPSGRGRAGRALLRSPRRSPRAGRAAPLRPVSATPKLTIIDGETRARAQLAMWPAPLMSVVIPPGGLHLISLLCRHLWPPLQNFWAPIIVRNIWRQMRQIWTRYPDSGQSPDPLPAFLTYARQFGK